MTKEEPFTGQITTECSSQIGKIGGEQIIRLGQKCHRNGTKIIIHELIHAWGFYHEQNSADRDEYIWVNKNNINASCVGNFVTAKYSNDFNEIYYAL